jgi:MGT family glycosyltransferase
MPRAIFFGLPAHGHMNPTLPLVRELVDRGEEVVYYSSADFEERIRRAGADFRPYRTSVLENFSVVTERMEQLSFLLMRATREVLDTELERVRASPPDYVIHDSLAAWGGCVAEVLGVPTAVSIVTFAFNRHVLMTGARVAPKRFSTMLAKLRFIAKAARVRRAIRAAYRTVGPDLSLFPNPRAGLKIVYTSRHFQPFADTFDESFRFVGPSIADRDEGVDLALPEPASSPLVYVSMGTLFNKDVEFYRACFAAFGGRDLRVVMSTGGTARIGDAPANFTVRDYVPQLEVLQRANAFVTHGGMNSVSESFYYGVPVVVIPQMSEQAVVGHRAQTLGAGLLLKKADAPASALRESVARVLENESFARNARAIGDSFKTAGGFERAADEVLAFVQNPRRHTNLRE